MRGNGTSNLFDLKISRFFFPHFESDEIFIFREERGFFFPLRILWEKNKSFILIHVLT